MYIVLAIYETVSRTRTYPVTDGLRGINRGATEIYYIMPTVWAHYSFLG